MKKTKKKTNKISLSAPQIIGAVITLALVIAAYYSLRPTDVSEGLQQFGREGSAQGSGDARPLVSTYENDEFGFSIKLPDGFEARESKMGDVSTIVLENKNAEGMQIVVSQFDEAGLEVRNGVKTLTKEMIVRDIPDLVVNDEQILEIGNNYNGIAFKSNNDAFDGDSREVWFVFDGHLFQISTFMRFDGLLRDLFTSWEFK